MATNPYVSTHRNRDRGNVRGPRNNRSEKRAAKRAADKFVRRQLAELAEMFGPGWIDANARTAREAKRHA